MPNPTADIPRDLPADAHRLATDPRLFDAFDAAAGDPRLRDLALRQPDALLAQFDVPLPKGLSVFFFEGHLPSRPYPFGDSWFPTITLTHCRHVWVRECKPGLDDRINCSFREEEACFGFEVIPARWVPPIA
ncbi:MAG TPA: hypothetical protein VMN56_09655 [Casimicrobiaceae bacterium]|nr:hypothetical protein [Casimicrobiaceae bacterium]